MQQFSDAIRLRRLRWKGGSLGYMVWGTPGFPIWKSTPWTECGSFRGSRQMKCWEWFSALRVAPRH
eukprot:8425660-Lingulodinium_polyedra.AAC.1